MRYRDLIPLLLGFLLACVFTNSAIGAERTSPILIRDAQNGDRIDLYAERNSFCESVDPDGKYNGHRAVYHYRKNHPQFPDKNVEGCYRVDNDVVRMIFEDGDQDGSKVSDFHTPGQGKNDI